MAHYECVCVLYAYPLVSALAIFFVHSFLPPRACSLCVRALENTYGYFFFALACQALQNTHAPTCYRRYVHEYNMLGCSQARVHTLVNRHWRCSSGNGCPATVLSPRPSGSAVAVAVVGSLCPWQKYAVRAMEPLITEQTEH